MKYPVVKLKPGRDIPVRAGHPWVFSMAIAEEPKAEPGTLVEVLANNGESLGLATYNPLTSIRARILTRDADEEIDADFFAKRFEALNEWKEKKLPPDTTGFRLVHAEADNLSGLVVDRYGDVFVVQLHTAGMDRLRAEILAGLQQAFEPIAVVERSDLGVRKMEGLIDQPVGVLFGKIEHLVEFKEAGLKFFADVMHGQKTGFFLDQREARLACGRLAGKKRVLNLFGYTGAFSVHAMNGGASFVTTVDSSRAALELAQKNFQANNFDPEDEKSALFLEADVLDLLADKKMPGAPYDMIVCDPPAFAKNEKQLPVAVKAYTELNAACLRLLKPGGILITSSCSGRLEPEDFRSLLRIAAGRAGRDARLLDWLVQPIDHAERLAFPEGRYLKTAILEVTDVLT